MTCAQPFRRLLDLPSDIVEYGFVQEWVEMTHASVFYPIRAGSISSGALSSHAQDANDTP